MNIFEFLGLPADHRKEKKVTQLVKHFDEVVDKHKTGKKLGCQVKEDGVCAITIVTKQGGVAIFSRTGKQFTNTSNIVCRISAMSLRSGIYMGEMWMPKALASLEQVSGATNPNRVNPLKTELAHIPNELRMSFFDYLSTRDFVLGSTNLNYYSRYVTLKSEIERAPFEESITWLPMRQVGLNHSISEQFKEALKCGKEGIVIRDMDAGWEAGHKGWRVMKLVRGVDYDLMCIGWEEGTGKYKGKVANLLFNWKGGKTIKAMLGKGWTHNMAEEMLKDCVINDGLSPVGRIFQVYALEESSKGKLRLVKVGERRHDKDESDV